MLHWMNDYRFAYIWIDVYQSHCISWIWLCCTTIVDIISCLRDVGSWPNYWITMNINNPPPEFIESLGKRPRYRKFPIQLQKHGYGSYQFKRDISGETPSASQVLLTEICSIGPIYWAFLRWEEGIEPGLGSLEEGEKLTGPLIVCVTPSIIFPICKPEFDQ